MKRIKIQCENNERNQPVRQCVWGAQREGGKAGQRLPLQAKAGAVEGSRAPAGKLDSRLHCRIREQFSDNVSGRDAVS